MKTKRTRAPKEVKVTIDLESYDRDRRGYILRMYALMMDLQSRDYRYITGRPDDIKKMLDHAERNYLDDRKELFGE